MKNKTKLRFLILNIFFIFFIGFFIGLNANLFLSQEKIIKETEFEISLFSQRIDFIKFFSLKKCNSDLFTSLIYEIYESGKKLREIEKDKKQDENYLKLKKIHTLTQINYYILNYEFYKTCKKKPNNIIIFFFDKENNSEKQGLILDEIYKKNKDLTIISMDYNYTEDFNYFYKNFKIEKLPALIVNFDEKLEGLQEEEKIIKILEK